MCHSYRFDVKEDGTLDNRKTFAFVHSGAPDGKSSKLYLVLLGLIFWKKASTAIHWVTCMLAVVMVSMSGIHLASSLARSMLDLVQRISTSLDRAEWLSALKQTFTMPR